MLNLKSFLVSNDSVVAQNSSRVLVKVEHPSKDIIFVMEERFANNGEFNPFKMDTQCLGLYNVKEDMFLFTDDLEIRYSDLDLNNLNVSNLEELKVEIESKVNEALISKIGKDENEVYVELKEYEKISDDVARSRAEDMFINDIELKEFSYADYVMNEIQYDITPFINYIIYPNLAIEEEADKYIEKNKKYIYRDMELNKRIQKYIEEIKNDEYAKSLKEMATIFNDSSIKTFNIHYKKDDKEMTFKVSNHIRLDRVDDTISATIILNAKEEKIFRDKFEEEGRWTFIIPKYIEEITYGKKILYKKK